MEARERGGGARGPWGSSYVFADGSLHGSGPHPFLRLELGACARCGARQHSLHPLSPYSWPPPALTCPSCGPASSPHATLPPGRSRARCACPQRSCTSPPARRPRVRAPTPSTSWRCGERGRGGGPRVPHSYVARHGGCKRYLLTQFTSEGRDRGTGAVRGWAEQ